MRFRPSTFPSRFVRRRPADRCSIIIRTSGWMRNGKRYRFSKHLPHPPLSHNLRHKMKNPPKRVSVLSWPSSARVRGAACSMTGGSSHGDSGRKAIADESGAASDSRRDAEARGVGVTGWRGHTTSTPNRCFIGGASIAPGGLTRSQRRQRHWFRSRWSGRRARCCRRRRAKQEGTNRSTEGTSISI